MAAFLWPGYTSTPAFLGSTRCTIDYKEAFNISDMPELLPLQNDVIVLHGMTVDGEYIATLPVACGATKPMNNGKGMGNGMARGKK